jgi:hypothetical protein
VNQRQIETKVKIEFFSKLFGIDPTWAVAIASVESSLGLNQRSSTNCLGVFQMSSISMQDLLQSMPLIDDDLIDIVCGIAFLRLLLKRWGSIDEATNHFCDPLDRHSYLDKVKALMKQDY